MRGFLQVFKMDFKNIIKNPVLIGYNTIFSIILTLVVGYLTSGSYGNISDAFSYYTVSFLIYAILNGSLTATNAFMERDIKKPNLRIIHSPIGSFPIYFSKILASSIFDFICHVLVLSILIELLHLKFGFNIYYIIILMIPLEVASCALGVLFCCIFKTEETASTLLSTFISILAFLGGTFFSLEGMGSALALISKLSPVKWLTDVFFSVIFDSDLSSFQPLLIGAIVVSALLTLGCMKFFRSEDYLC